MRATHAIPRPHRNSVVSRRRGQAHEISRLPRERVWETLATKESESFFRLREKKKEKRPLVCKHTSNKCSTRLFRILSSVFFFRVALESGIRRSAGFPANALQDVSTGLMGPSRRHAEESPASLGRACNNCASARATAAGPRNSACLLVDLALPHRLVVRSQHPARPSKKGGRSLFLVGRRRQRSCAFGFHSIAAPRFTLFSFLPNALMNPRLSLDEEHVHSRRCHRHRRRGMPVS